MDVVIEKLVAGGDGLARADGKAVFVPGVLPGETARVHVFESRRDFDRAELREVLVPSPARVATPACPLAGACGGCDWLHVSHPAQVGLKAGIVAEALRRVGKVDCGTPAVEQGPALGYRNRVQAHVGAGGRLGYMAARSAEVVPAAGCPVAVAPIDGLFARAAAGGMQWDFSRFTVFSEGTWLAREGADDERVLEVEVLDTNVRFSVGCFFQGNLSLLGSLAGFALDGIGGGTVADLYCGVGLFGALLREKADRIVAVDSSAMSVSFARQNIGEKGEFYPMSVEQWIAGGGARGGIDVAVVDPPRAGLGPEVRAFLVRTKPARIRYVSCNPVTLARDVGSLARAGYELEALRLFDFYPQTSHVEAVARLIRGS
jgi:23S rRNA (uracil1939-C5)-methyltransferase